MTMGVLRLFTAVNVFVCTDRLDVFRVRVGLS
jgi:hypothetical protein